MKAGRRYDIFPRTFKARLLLALAFLGGLTIVGFSVAYDALTLDFKLFGDVEVTVENRTERQLTIYVQGRSEAIVPVGETVSITTLKIQWRFGGALVQAVDSDGIIVFRDDLDLDDLRDIDHHIVIEAPAGGLAIGPPCRRPEQEGCLEAQTELEPITLASCARSDLRVCFVPLGQVDPDLVRNLVQYYRDEYGLGIGVLTPSAVPAGMSNPDREQIDGASLATYLGTLFRPTSTTRTWRSLA